MPSGCLWFVLLLLSTAVGSLTGMEESAGFLPFWNVCSVRRMFDRRLCCGDSHCAAGQCCQMEMSFQSFSVEGRCVPRDSSTRLCVRRRHCVSDGHCLPGECCRADESYSRKGVCSGYNKEGDACFYGFYFYTALPVTCPCSPGLSCLPSLLESNRGVCRAPNTVTPRRLPSLPAYTTFKATAGTNAAPPSVTSATTTTTTTEASVVSECTTDSECLDMAFFCCFSSLQCRLRPAPGDDCGVNTCPCRDSICSNPTGAAQRNTVVSN